MPKLSFLLPLFSTMLLNAINRGNVFADITGNETVEALRAMLVTLNEDALAIQAKADTEKRDLSEDEEAELTGILDEFDRIESSIKRRSRMKRALAARRMPALMTPHPAPDNSASPVNHAAQDQAAGAGGRLANTPALSMPPVVRAPYLMIAS